jgi:hypothetical protein
MDDEEHVPVGSTMFIPRANPWGTLLPDAVNENPAESATTYAMAAFLLRDE